MPQQILLFCENDPMTSEHLLQHCPLHDDRQAAFVDTIHAFNESTYRSVAVHRKVYGFKCDGDRRRRKRLNVKTNAWTRCTYDLSETETYLFMTL